MTSIFPIAYGCSKFLSGVLGARTSPSLLLAGGLMATAVMNVMFGFGTSLAWFCTFWALNGVLQVRGVCGGGGWGGHLLGARVQAIARPTHPPDRSAHCTPPPPAQGLGGPCCARILTSWFATKERGTYWGMWNIAHNLGGFAAPIFAGTMAKLHGWKWGM